jgi:hypothetical protein
MQDVFQFEPARAIDNVLQIILAKKKNQAAGWPCAPSSMNPDIQTESPLVFPSAAGGAPVIPGHNQ